MGSLQNPDPITDETLSRIWDQHDLGPVLTVEHPKRGIINHTLIVNAEYVIRFYLLTTKGKSRFESEALAYAALRVSPVPVPRVAALDQSKLIVPYDYLVTAKLPGRPVVDGALAVPPQHQDRFTIQRRRFVPSLDSKHGNGGQCPSTGVFSPASTGIFRRFCAGG